MSIDAIDAIKVVKYLPMVAGVVTPKGIVYPEVIMKSIVVSIKKLCPRLGDKIDEKDKKGTHKIQDAEFVDGRIKLYLDVYDSVHAEGLKNDSIKLVIAGKIIVTPIGGEQLKVTVFEPIDIHIQSAAAT